jgi:uncharacterized phage protein (TIGR02220 family)
MRDYGEVRTSFWTSTDTQGLSDQGKVLAIYLLTGPHSNGLGCYRLPDGYIQADLGWSPQTVSKGFSELFAKGFILRCEVTQFVLIPSYLKFNPIANGNVAKGREREFESIPANFKYFRELAASMERFGNHWVNGFETLLKGFATPDPDPDPDPDPLNTLSGKGPTDEEIKKAKREAAAKAKREAAAKLKADSIEILEFLNRTADRNFQQVEPNLRLIAARIREGAEVQDIKCVIAKKAREWKAKDGADMTEYLRPKTLFNATNFAQYFGELGRSDA